jgi:hypothetical protein
LAAAENWDTKVFAAPAETVGMCHVLTLSSKHFAYAEIQWNSCGAVCRATEIGKGSLSWAGMSREAAS